MYPIRIYCQCTAQRPGGCRLRSSSHDLRAYETIVHRRDPLVPLRIRRLDDLTIRRLDGLMIGARVAVELHELFRLHVVLHDRVTSVQW